MRFSQSFRQSTAVIAAPGDWRMRPVCRRSDPSVSFGPEGNAAATVPAGRTRHAEFVRAARSLCRAATMP